MLIVHYVYSIIYIHVCSIYYTNCECVCVSVTSGAVAVKEFILGEIINYLLDLQCSSV